MTPKPTSTSVCIEWVNLYKYAYCLINILWSNFLEQCGVGTVSLRAWIGRKSPQELQGIVLPAGSTYTWKTIRSTFTLWSYGLTKSGGRPASTIKCGALASRSSAVWKPPLLVRPSAWRTFTPVVVQDGKGPLLCSSAERDLQWRWVAHGLRGLLSLRSPPRNSFLNVGPGFLF